MFLRDGVYAVNLKLIARGNWRNVGVIDYQIGIKREGKKKKIIQNTFLTFLPTAVPVNKHKGRPFHRFFRAVTSLTFEQRVRPVRDAASVLPVVQAPLGELQHKRGQKVKSTPPH